MTPCAFIWWWDGPMLLLAIGFLVFVACVLPKALEESRDEDVFLATGKWPERKK